MSEFIKKVIASLSITPTGQKRLVPAELEVEGVLEIKNDFSVIPTKTEEVFRLQTRFEQQLVVSSCVKSVAEFSTAEAVKKVMLKHFVDEIYGEYLEELWIIENLLYMGEIEGAKEQIREIVRDMMEIE